MKMRKQWALLALSGLLTFSSLPAAAEEAAEETLVAGTGGASVEADAPAMSVSGIDFTACPGLSRNLKLSPEAYYTGMRSPKSGETLPMGQIYVSQKNVDMTAHVFSFASDAPEVAEVLAGVFASDENGNVGKECLDALKAFNDNLAGLPVAANMGILKAVEGIRAATGEDIPYSLFYTDFRAVESLHLLRAPVRIATTGVRLYLYVDGWVLPMYVKAYVWQEGGGYRFLLTEMADAEKDALMKTSDALAIAAAMN